jgi:hypothetical protein
VCSSGKERIGGFANRAKGQLARVDAGGSKVNEDLSNVQEELAKLKEEIKQMKITTNQWPRSVMKEKLRLRTGQEPDKMYDTPDGIIGHLARDCGGNLRNYDVVDVTCRSFEKETQGDNPDSGRDLVGARVLSHAASVENLFSHQPVMPIIIPGKSFGFSLVAAAMPPGSTTVTCIKFIGS